MLRRSRSFVGLAALRAAGEAYRLRRAPRIAAALVPAAARAAYARAVERAAPA
jgi:hypothetical protein